MKKHKFRIIPFLILVVVFFIILGIKSRNHYLDKLSASDKLIDYILYDKQDFVEEKEKNSYSRFQDLITMKRNDDFYKKFAFSNKDVLKNLFYFSKQLVNFQKDTAYNLYTYEKHSWNQLIVSTSVISGNYNDYYSLKNKPKFLILFMVGNKLPC